MSFIHRSILGILVAGLACGPDTGGLSSSDGSGSGSSGTEGSPTTSETTTTSTTASTVATSDADSGSTTAAPTTGPMDTTADGSSSGEPPGTGSSGDEPPPPSYPACDPEGDPCPDPYTFCVALGGGGGGIGSWCSLECMDVAECPVPDSGTAEPICGGPPMQPTRCELDCAMGDCPDGMDCVGLGPGGAIMRCVWPPA